MNHAAGMRLVQTGADLDAALQCFFCRERPTAEAIAQKLPVDGVLVEKIEILRPYSSHGASRKTSFRRMRQTHLCTGVYTCWILTTTEVGDGGYGAEY